MKKLSFYLMAGWLMTFQVNAQVGINADNSAPDPSSGLDVKFSDKGLLFPRLTQDQILSINNPANGLLVFCSTDNKMYIFVASEGQWGQWKEISYGTGTLVQQFKCGMSLTINHVAGEVAPVTKTTTYGTVTNFPGGAASCWITSNLGSDHQATSAYDITEASAGWYWQFNRKQGYTHDETSLIPEWLYWTIDEDYDWIAANDPCSLELGPEWHLPTYSEWESVDLAGEWYNRDDAWESPLKLHTAGWLMENGGLRERGFWGHYWSSTQTYTGTTWAYELAFGLNSGVTTNHKAYGFTVRCLRY